MSDLIAADPGQNSVTTRLELPLTPPSDTFCICAWTQLEFHSDGRAWACYEWVGPPVCKDGVPMSAHEHTLDETWNSAEMRDMRRRMVEGRKVGGCSSCYDREAAGILSMRQIENSLWESGLYNDEMRTLDDLKALALANDFRVPTGPERLSLHLGDLCNLKCRTCTTHNSVKIARDPVHSQWAHWPMRSQDGALWVKNEWAVRSGILARPEQLRNIHLTGGEPLLIKEVEAILQHLVDAGVSQQVLVSVSTNAATAQARWLRLAERLKGLNLIVSIDGIAEDYDYVRYPARWDTLVRTLEALRKVPNVSLNAHVTVLSYNMLRAAELFRFFDSIDLPFGAYPLIYPPHLSPRVMPHRARQVAAERLHAYAASACREWNLSSVEDIIADLEAENDQPDPGLLREFMLFTNDLDASRGQDFRSTNRELFDYILETGSQWTDETLHATKDGGVALPVVSEG